MRLILGIFLIGSWLSSAQPAQGGWGCEKIGEDCFCVANPGYCSDCVRTQCIYEGIDCCSGGGGNKEPKHPTP